MDVDPQHGFGFPFGFPLHRAQHSKKIFRQRVPSYFPLTPAYTFVWACLSVRGFSVAQCLKNPTKGTGTGRMIFDWLAIGWGATSVTSLSQYPQNPRGAWLVLILVFDCGSGKPGRAGGGARLLPESQSQSAASAFCCSFFSWGSVDLFSFSLRHVPFCSVPVNKQGILCFIPFRLCCNM